jgi:NAD-dependent deacetylase
MDEKLRSIIADSKRVVFFGGAGVSTESGIPDFRSADGLYNLEWAYPPETMLSRDFFERNTAEFYRFYRAKMIISGVSPNRAHKALAQLEAEGKLTAVVTQNIDGLHQAAGSHNVLELHGSIHRSFCRKCGRPYGLAFIAESSGVPQCTCGGVVKPDVVLYGEGLNDDVVARSVAVIAECDTLIVGGTSLAVYPAAGLINYYRGKSLVLINKTATPYDDRADFLFRGSIGYVLGGDIAGE